MRLELSHQLAREALGKSIERAKRQYDKNIRQAQYHVGDAVWYLVKGTKRVKNKVRKFLPSYEGPYFIVGKLDDLIYRIKKGQRSKAKVVHHDKIKLYYSRAQLDNAWVFQDAGAWKPVEVLPSLPDLDPTTLDIGMNANIMLWTLMLHLCQKGMQYAFMNILFTFPPMGFPFRNCGNFELFWKECFSITMFLYAPLE